jgi:anti-sigma regulatory factor (Ser/Thr protein kinase)
MTGRAGTVNGQSRARAGGAGPAFHRRLRHAAADLAPVPAAAPAARAVTRLVLPRWGLAALADDAELVGCELVTNAVRAAGQLPGQPPVRLRLTAIPRGVIIGVWDAAPGGPARRQPGPDGGQGLVIIEALSARWGVRRVEGGGKIVWAVCVM